MKPSVVGMVDAGFLTRSISGALQIPVGEVHVEGEELTSWFLVAANRMNNSLLRCYWYDGQYPEGAALRSRQRAELDKLEECAGIQLRLGHLQSLPFEHKEQLRAAASTAGIDYSNLMKHFNLETRYTQKGVDTLIVLDMLRFVQQGMTKRIVLVAGDRDLAEAVREIQNLGATIILAYPQGAPVAKELGNLADEKVVWSEDLLRRLISKRGDRIVDLIDKVRSETELLTAANEARD
ncbi:NYN domain-containing protein [Streptosporangium sp. NPDC087985]|uniref:NYN domain-containing protein n=1 Tax=Streptosporangium sp. NPDC087985 TaxID=3366196 RepID=UPI00382DF1E1